MYKTLIIGYFIIFTGSVFIALFFVLIWGYNSLIRKKDIKKEEHNGRENKNYEITCD